MLPLPLLWHSVIILLSEQSENQKSVRWAQSYSKYCFLTRVSITLSFTQFYTFRPLLLFLCCLWSWSRRIQSWCPCLWNSHQLILRRAPLNLFESTDQAKSRWTLRRHILADLIHFLYIGRVYHDVSTWRQVWKMNPVKMMENRKSSNLIIAEFPRWKATLRQFSRRQMRVADNLGVRLPEELKPTVLPPPEPLVTYDVRGDCLQIL